MERQIGQAERQHQLLGPRGEGGECKAGHRERHGRTGGEQHLHDAQIARPQKTDRTDREPRRDGDGKRA